MATKTKKLAKPVGNWTGAMKTVAKPTAKPKAKTMDAKSKMVTKTKNLTKPGMKKPGVKNAVAKPKDKPKAKIAKVKIKSASKPKSPASSTKYSNPTMFGDRPGARDYYAPENPPISFLPPEVEPTGRTLFNDRDFLHYPRPIPPTSRLVIDHPWPMSWLVKLFKKK